MLSITPLLNTYGHFFTAQETIRRAREAQAAKRASQQVPSIAYTKDGTRYVDPESQITFEIYM